ncbi:MAG: M24 family metallopeptidase [Enterococcus sp.]
MKYLTKAQIELTEIKELQLDRELRPFQYTDATMQERYENIQYLMHQENLDALVIYGDLEHGGNFEYFTGFVTRFEEGVLVIHKTGKNYLLLGNENLNKAEKARIPVEAIHVPHFSLPNQPMENDQPLAKYFEAAELTSNMQVGVVGWKLFISQFANYREVFDLPNYLIQALDEVVGLNNLSNRTDLLIGGACGVRTTNNANEIAHYEFGAQLASLGMSRALAKFDLHVSEMEIGHVLNQFGQRPNVVTIAATGERFELANIYPTDKKVRLGDPVSLTIGYKGGLSSRAGYAVNNEYELPSDVSDYLDVLAKPYYATVVNWLENIRLGMSGGELYQFIESVFPKAEYGWHLNPGHLTADEEWLSSPIYPHSTERLRSGMILQIDIIPSRPGYAGTSCESGIALADAVLRAEIKAAYPELYQVFKERRQYLKEVLNIDLPKEVLPMNDTVAYYRPFFLAKNLGLKKARSN